MGEIAGLNGAREHTYYKRQKKLFEAAREQQGFAEVTPVKRCEEDIAVTVRIAGAEADIHCGADEGTVGMVLRMLKSC